MSERHIALEGAQNFRDFGGYQTAQGRRVKRGQLFRSGRLNTLSPRDHEIMETLGIQLICDLRRASELAQAPTVWQAAPAPEMLHLPLFGDDNFEGPSSWQQAADQGRVRERMLDVYARLVTLPHSVARYTTLFERLAGGTAFPVLLHCSAGKDRTGVACALILSALGVSREDVIADYLLTEIHYDGLKDIARLASQALDFGRGPGWSPEKLAPAFRVERAYIETALDAIEARHGSARAFLTKAAGVPHAQLDALAQHLLEDSR
jgi:protein-tyrosine phosphatase